MASIDLNQLGKASEWPVDPAEPDLAAESASQIPDFFSSALNPYIDDWPGRMVEFWEQGLWRNHIPALRAMMRECEVTNRSSFVRHVLGTKTIRTGSDRDYYDIYSSHNLHTALNTTAEEICSNSHKVKRLCPGCNLNSGSDNVPPVVDSDKKKRDGRGLKRSNLNNEAKAPVPKSSKDGSHSSPQSTPAVLACALRCPLTSVSSIMEVHRSGCMCFEQAHLRTAFGRISSLNLEVYAARFKSESEEKLLNLKELAMTDGFAELYNSRQGFFTTGPLARDPLSSPSSLPTRTRNPTCLVTAINNALGELEEHFSSMPLEAVLSYPRICRTSEALNQVVLRAFKLGQRFSDAKATPLVRVSFEANLLFFEKYWANRRPADFIAIVERITRLEVPLQIIAQCPNGDTICAILREMCSNENSEWLIATLSRYNIIKTKE